MNILIVGSGIGGMACAAVLASKGIKVKILEIKDDQQKVRVGLKQTEKDPNIADLEKELSDKIGLKTEIEFSENGSSGSLKLYYSDLNQLDEIMKRLKK